MKAISEKLTAVATGLVRGSLSSLLDKLAIAKLPKAKCEWAELSAFLQSASFSTALRNVLELDISSICHETSKEWGQTQVATNTLFKSLAVVAEQFGQDAFSVTEAPVKETSALLLSWFEESRHSIASLISTSNAEHLQTWLVFFGTAISRKAIARLVELVLETGATNTLQTIFLKDKLPALTGSAIKKVLAELAVSQEHIDQATRNKTPWKQAPLYMRRQIPSEAQLLKWLLVVRTVCVNHTCLRGKGSIAYFPRRRPSRTLTPPCSTTSRRTVVGRPRCKSAA